MSTNVFMQAAQAAKSFIPWKFQSEEIWSKLITDLQFRLEFKHFMKHGENLAKPLSQAKNTHELQATLERQLSAYNSWKGMIFSLIQNSIDQSNNLHSFMESYKNTNEDLQSKIRNDSTNFLNDDEVDRLLIIASGVITYSETLFETLLRDGTDALDTAVVQKTFEAFLRADFLLATTIWIIERLLLRWSFKARIRKSLLRIIELAESYVLRIENELLANDAILLQQLGQVPSNSITIESYRQRRGI